MPQQLVAYFVTQGVVDPAEVIEVDEERRHQLLIPAGLLQGVGQALLVGQPVGKTGQAVVVGQLAHLVEHARVGQRHGGLVGQAAHLHPIFLGGHQIEALTQRDDAGQLALVGQRQHDERGRAQLHQRLEVGGDAFAACAAPALRDRSECSAHPCARMPTRATCRWPVS